MIRPSKKEIAKKYKPGTRIRLHDMDKEYDMPDGLKGTVKYVDDIGQIHMQWDNGRTLALVIGIDHFEII